MTRCSADSAAMDAGNFLTTVGMSGSAVPAGNQGAAHTAT